MTPKRCYRPHRTSEWRHRKSSPGAQSKVSSVKYDQRTYRAERTYAVTDGKWYFEFEVLTLGVMKVGWAGPNFLPSCELGGDDNSWAFDGFKAAKNHAGGSEVYGKQWQIGDVIGCMLDLHDRTISERSTVAHTLLEWGFQV
ncbi:putative ryanodine receptor [Ixodes scapularis]